MHIDSIRALSKIAVPALLGLLTACSAAAGADDETLSAESAGAVTANEQGAYNFFVNKGLTSFQAAGIVGNLMQESGVDASSVQPGGPGRGIAQWSVGGRWNSDHGDNLEWFASTHGQSARSLTLQLEFVWYELETFPSYGLSRLRASRNVAEATVAFQTNFEGCGVCEQGTRIRYAEAVLATHGGGGGGGGAGGGTCYSGTLHRTMPHDACVQSASNRQWYQCANGYWTDRFSDPSPCNGVHPL